MIPKGKVLQADMPTKEQFEQKIKQVEEAIAFAEEEIELRREALKIQNAHPRPLEPRVEFETKEEWVKYLVKQNDFQSRKAEWQIKGELERLKREVKLTKKEMIKLHGVEKKK